MDRTERRQIQKRAEQRHGLVDGSWTASLFPGMWPNEKDWESLDEPILFISNYSEINPNIWVSCLLRKISRR